MDPAESDATYCSEVEKENISLLRRSKRLSQKLSESFRSDEDPVLKRFKEIQRILETESSCEDYTKEDWCSLKGEVNAIRNSLRCVPKSKLTFVVKKIEHKLRILRIDSNLQEFSRSTNESLNRNVEKNCHASLDSPNVLAEMTTEHLTEIPPYQPNNLFKITEMTGKINLNTETHEYSQINPLDLTKKPVNVCQPVDDIPRDGNENIDITSGPMIDLTKISQDKENIAPRNDCISLSKDNEQAPSTIVHTSKWLKYLPSQQRPQDICPRMGSCLQPMDKPKPFKQSLISLFKDTVVAEDQSTHEAKTSKFRHRPPRTRSDRKSKHKNNSRHPLNSKYLRHTESVFSRRCAQLESIELNNVQTEHVTRLRQQSPISFGEDVLTFSDNNSSVSLPCSLKKSFQKVFGANILDVLGCDKIVYSLTERHVERLAKALKVQKEFLKVRIEKILVDDQDQEEENDQTDGSVLECSQSPTPRLHPSQRS